MKKRNSTDPCDECGHLWVEHRWRTLADDGVDTSCYQAACSCSGFVDATPVVEPGHDQFGTESGFLRLCKCKLCESFTPGGVDVDLLLALKDNYDACMAQGVHPEWTIGGA